MPFNPMDDHGYLRSLIEARETEDTMRQDPLHDFRTLSGTRPARPSLTEARSGITEHERRLMHEAGVPEIEESAVDRKEALKIIWRKTPKDYKGKVKGKKAVLVNTPNGTTLSPLDGLKKDEIEKLLPKGYSLGEAQGHADDLSDVKIQQKPGEDYWYVKKGAVTIGVVSKHGDGDKYDADTDPEGEGRFKKGFDSVKDAARYVVKHNTRTGASDKKESELGEGLKLRDLDVVDDAGRGYKPGSKWFTRALKAYVKGAGKMNKAGRDWDGWSVLTRSGDKPKPEDVKKVLGESRELDEVFKSRKSYQKGKRHPRTGKLGTPEKEGGQTSSGRLGSPEDEDDLPLRPNPYGALGEPDDEDYVPGNPYSKRKRHKYTAKAGRRTGARTDPDDKSYGHGPMRKGSVKIKEDEDEDELELSDDLDDLDEVYKSRKSYKQRPPARTMAFQKKQVGPKLGEPDDEAVEDDEEEYEDED